MRGGRRPLPIAVLVSGGGTNLQAIIDAVEAGLLDARIRVVLSNRPGAYALERAARAGIPIEVVEGRGFPDRGAYDERLVEVLRRYDIELVVLAGFMRILSPAFIKAFAGRIMNIHPSLLPSFPGLDVQRKALEAGVKFSGCTVHFVDEGVDTGPIIIQAVVPVLDDDTVESLSARILEQEHRIYPQAIRLFAEGRLRVEGRRVLVRDGEGASGALANPPVRIFDRG
ncbi:MAG TPA: phosphoribosylglycinamide formyltransferase [Deltaproteobacteria bacterium]|nr:phosphoribosylglycinamide formyltransferase [Deltaproteobacteria bacterium]